MSPMVSPLLKLKIPQFQSPDGVKIHPATRCMAKAIDMSAIFFLALILPYPIGVLLGFAYTLVHDGLFNGQSLGKRVFHLKAVQAGQEVIVATPEMPACTVRESVIRNVPLGVATFFAIIPFWGWIILVLLGVPLVLLEVYLMLTSPTGSRLGDVMADTRVVQLKNLK